MRTFVAIELPEDVRQNLAQLQERLRKSRVRVSWTKPETMHLTLRFLGEISEEDAARVGEMLAERYAGAHKFPLHVAGTGAFPNMKRPSVLWAGGGPLEGPLAEVQQAAEDAARKIGLKREKRAYHPHLTIGRVKDPAGAFPLMRLLAREKDFEGGGFSVDRVTLFSSKLSPKGAIHTPLREFELAPQEAHD